MRDAVHRPQELRRRLLHAAYAALLEDPDGFLDVTSVSLADTEDPIPPAGLDDGVAARLARADFRAAPPAPLELRAATYYIVEQQLAFLMPPEALTKAGLDADAAYLHITARGIDAFEALVLAGEHRELERPIGFRMGPPDPSAARPRPRGDTGTASQEVWPE